jgi:hypothetical protein
MTSVEWHEALARALDQEIKGSDFFLWLRVEGEAGLPGEGEVRSLVQRTRHWLDDLKVDAVEANRPPTLSLVAGTAEIELTAIPKNPAARSSSGPVVGNPVPPRAFWN